MNRPPRLAVTLGDPAGIGPELALHLTPRLAENLHCQLHLVGDSELLATLFPGRFDPRELSRDGRLTFDDVCSLDPREHRWGALSAESGHAAFRFLEHAIALARSGEVDGIVTLPISKEALHRAGHEYPGHTEILAEKTGTRRYAMMLWAERLKIVHVTTHVSVRHALAGITLNRILEVTRLAHVALEGVLGRLPRIAVCGLNPHAGESGLLGSEEQRVITPAIEMAQGQGMRVEGPLPPDTVFAQALAGRYDLVVAMLHDQGHIAFKTALFDLGDARKTSGVNVMLGLPFVRTSVDHGTAFDIAGRGKADPGSFMDALRLAARLCLTRAD